MCCSGVVAQQGGSLDITFNPGSGVAGFVNSVALSANGQLLLGGQFQSINGQSRNYVARLNSDGSLDTGFLPGQGPNGVVNAVEVDLAGNVYVGGNFSSFNGIPASSLARLRGDGSLDLSWTGSTISFGEVTAIKRQADGTLLVIGVYANDKVIRLNADGSLDPFFNPVAGVTDHAVNAVAIQPDGKVIIAGDFTTNSPVSRQCLARVSATGILDPTFDAGYIGGGNPVINALALQPDGKILVGGFFSSINGYSLVGVARLNTNGAVDATFVSPFTGGPRVLGVQLLPDSRLLICGTEFSPPLLRLNYNGSFDGGFSTTFNAAGGAEVESFVVQTDGKIVIGGYFSSVDGTNISGIARLSGTTTNLANLQFLSVNPYAGMFLSGIVSNSYRVEWTTNLNTSSLWTPLFDVTLQTNPQLIFDTAPMGGRQRFYRAVALP